MSTNEQRPCWYEGKMLEGKHKGEVLKSEHFVGIFLFLHNEVNRLVPDRIRPPLSLSVSLVGKVHQSKLIKSGRTSLGTSVNFQLWT